jgi:hypothetical protein
MPIPKLVAIAACIGILGAQLAVALPFASDRSWYWPFLPYPMYAQAHSRSDTLVVPQLRVTECGGATRDVILSASALGAQIHQLRGLLSVVARVPGSDSAIIARGVLSRAIEAQFPARYCEASAWVRTVRVADTSTYGLHNPMRRAAAWDLNGKEFR